MNGQPIPSIQVPVDVTNPGQFFACCGLLELADRLWPGAEGWFENGRFLLHCNARFKDLVEAFRSFTVTNTMSEIQQSRLKDLSAKPKSEREKLGLEEEKKSLEALRREAPILFQSLFHLQIDWFSDEFSGGSRFKTWAGQQSVLGITSSMHEGLRIVDPLDESTIWNSERGGGLPFNFDSDLGGQGSALDIGFSFDPLAASELTRIESSCRPALEVLAFIGLQRFRPREIPRQNRFIYVAWQQPLPPSAAAPLVCQAVSLGVAQAYEFRLLYRTKYLKSFLPAKPFLGDNDE